jgi:hypothetical protein
MNDLDEKTFEMRSQALFQESVEGLDMRIRSRLTQARSAALDAASSRRPAGFGWKVWTPAAGLTAAAILGVAIWLGAPLHHQSATFADAQSSFEDLDLLASSDEGSADAMEMLQDDIDFYDFADKAANSGPTA